MITLIEALNFRCLRYVRQPLDRFHVLIGPNASGKSSFLDVPSFLGRILSDGLEAAIAERTNDFRDLVWQRKDGHVELAVEATFPPAIHQKLPDGRFDTIRYEIAVGYDLETKEVQIRDEKVILKNAEPREKIQRSLFPDDCLLPPNSIITSKNKPGTKRVATKTLGGNDNYYPEVSSRPGKSGWVPAFKLGPKRSTLANLPEDETRFPASVWLKQLLTAGVQQVTLDSSLMRKASPPGARLRGFRTDGSNLPWVINVLEKTDERVVKEWIAHVRTALPDVRNARTIERLDDRHRYLVLEYAGKLLLPSWAVSDGTLRLLALTLLAYSREATGVYLIEEPENGIHPKAVDIVIQSLSSVYNAQVLLATHSPVVLSTAKPESILCFAKNSEGAADIVLGTDHPKLRDWKGEENLSVLFASGILG